MASFLDVFIKAGLSIDKLSAFAIPAFRIIYHSMAKVAGRFSRNDRFHVLQVRPESLKQIVCRQINSCTGRIDWTGSETQYSFSFEIIESFDADPEF
jgi:hypothetical protein